MAVSTVEKCAGWTNFDAVTALRAVEPSEIRADHRMCATATCFDRVLAHPLVTHAGATFAKDATLRIVRNHRREISLGVIVFLFGESFFEPAPVERHLLEFAFAAAIANRAIERVVCEQKLGHATLSFFDFFTLRGDDHAVGASDCAGRLQLRHLLDAHQTHATRGLQREIRVVTERWDIKSLFATHIDQTCALRDFKIFVINRDFDEIS